MKGRNGGKTKAWRRADVQIRTCQPVVQVLLHKALTTGRGLLDVPIPSRWGRWAKRIRFVQGVTR